MSLAALILVEPAQAGNLGAVMRLAANFAIPRLELVRPRVLPDAAEVVRWACGAEEHLEVVCQESLSGAAARYRTLVGSASGRGRTRLPTISIREAAQQVAARGPALTAAVFGNETSGLCRADLDLCDVVVRIGTQPRFPVLNLAQAVAIMVGYLSTELADDRPTLPPPATEERIEGLMDHLRCSLLDIGFLDPDNPDRVLRKLRRLLGRAAVTDNEVAILRGICRQVLWASRRPPTRWDPAPAPDLDPDPEDS